MIQGFKRLVNNKIGVINLLILRLPEFFHPALLSIISKKYRLLYFIQKKDEAAVKRLLEGGVLSACSDHELTYFFNTLKKQKFSGDEYLKLTSLLLFQIETEFDFSKMLKEKLNLNREASKHRSEPIEYRGFSNLCIYKLVLLSSGGKENVFFVKLTCNKPYRKDLAEIFVKNNFNIPGHYGTISRKGLEINLLEWIDLKHLSNLNKNEFNEIISLSSDISKLNLGSVETKVVLSADYFQSYLSGSTAAKFNKNESGFAALKKVYENREHINKALSSFPTAFNHMDFTWINIFRTGKGFLLIDFNEAGMAPLGYDLASFIFGRIEMLSEILEGGLADCINDTCSKFYGRSFFETNRDLICLIFLMTGLSIGLPKLARKNYIYHDHFVKLVDIYLTELGKELSRNKYLY